MQLKNLFLFLALGLLALFSAANWPEIMQPTELSLIFTKVTAPLGLILLIATALLFVLFLAYLVYWQSSILMARQKLIKDLETQRQLANEAESSRFTELRQFLEAELNKMSAQTSDAKNESESRMTDIESSIKSALEQTGNSLSAFIGELGDRLDKK